MTTTTTADPFATDRLPQVPHGQIPPELLEKGSPFAKLGADFERLSGEYAQAVAELHTLTRGKNTAAKEDKQALAAAMSSGKPDPGDPATAALAEKCVSQRRRVEGLADATHAVFRELNERLESDDGARWGETLDATIDTSAERVEELLAELADALDAIDSPARAVHWLGRVRAVPTGPGATSLGGGFPSLMGGEPRILVEGHQATRDSVFAAIRATVADTRPVS